MVREEKLYITSDGKEYKTRKYAVRHENMLKFEKLGYSKSEVDSALEEISVNNQIIRILLKDKKDWRDFPDNFINQLPKLIEDHKNDVVVYKIIKLGFMGRDEEDILSVKHPRLKDGELPKELLEYVNELTEKDKDKNGSTFKLVEHEKQDKKVKYKVVEDKLTPEDKIKLGKELNEDDLSELVWERPQVYEVEGDDRRWYRAVTTVIEALDGNCYAIEWDRGLTENQEHGYDEQPKKVKLEEREVVTTVTEIVYLDE